MNRALESGSILLEFDSYSKTHLLKIIQFKLQLQQDDNSQSKTFAAVNCEPSVDMWIVNLRPGPPHRAAFSRQNVPEGRVHARDMKGVSL